MSPRAKHELAREHLNRGLAVADKHGVDTQKQHWKKVEIAVAFAELEAAS